MALPLSYVGVLDDFALRYDDGAIRNTEDLNRHLILATLFSDPLLINDGYLLSHATIQDALMNPDSSPLKALVECGYIKILSRNDGDLGGLAKWMADVGISSAQDRLQDEYFRERYQPLLRAWTERLRSPAYNPFRGWPNIQMTEVFKAVSRDALSVLMSHDDEHGTELAEFRKRLSDTPARRTDWEDIGLALRQAGQLSEPTFLALMKTANEAYQYSWGCALARDLGSVRVLTRMPKHLARFEVSELTISDTPRKPIQVAIPDVAFAVKSVNGKWKRLADVVTTGSELNILKHDFLDSLRAYYGSEDGDSENVERCGKEYTVALSQHFGNPRGLNVVFDLTFVGASTLAGGMAAGPVGLIAGAALGVTGVAASHLGGPKLLWRLSAPSPKKWLIDRNLSAPPESVSAFLIKKTVASQYTEGVPAFRS